jgi:hypothetical protein
MLDLIERYQSPVQLAPTSKNRLADRLTTRPQDLGCPDVQALTEQAVVLLGTQAATIVLPRTHSNWQRCVVSERTSLEKASKEPSNIIFIQHARSRHQDRPQTL